MSYLILLYTLLLTTTQGAPIRKSQTRIVNGIEARPGEFPYQVSLQRYNTHTCGGSIINENYVLTAAHCVGTRNQTNIYKVVAGTVNLKNLSESATVHKVVDIRPHKKYVTGNGWKNDIALIKVDPPFKFNKYIAPVELPRINETVSANESVVVSGFGKTSRYTGLSSKLLKAKSFVVDLEHCQSYYAATIRLTNICAQNTVKATGFCKADSGGPLSVDGRIVGIVSFSTSNGCIDNDFVPQVYTKVSFYIDWILSHTLSTQAMKFITRNKCNKK